LSFSSDASDFCPGIYNYWKDPLDPFIYRDKDGWIPIQTRGQCGFPNNYFSTKLWADYVIGFGLPGILFYFQSNNMGVKNVCPSVHLFY
jgi:hypothetical protein